MKYLPAYIEAYDMHVSLEVHPHTEKRESPIVHLIEIVKQQTQIRDKASELMEHNQKFDVEKRPESSPTA